MDKGEGLFPEDHARGCLIQLLCPAADTFALRPVSVSCRPRVSVEALQALVPGPLHQGHSRQVWCPGGQRCPGE